MPDGWVVPEYRSIATRPLVLGLPPGYAVLVIVAAALIGTVAKILLAALILLGFGWGVGALVTLYDPYAWELFVRQARVPRVIPPC
jgi:type IV secretory pathway VirB3-like protein